MHGIHSLIDHWSVWPDQNFFMQLYFVLFVSLQHFDWATARISSPQKSSVGDLTGALHIFSILSSPAAEKSRTV